jgi:hypothetical protein
MAEFTIAAVATNEDGSPRTRAWNSEKGGPMLSYRMTLRNAQGAELSNVEWSRKQDSQPPAVGQSIEGEVDTTGEYGPKFKAAQRPGGTGGGGGGRPRDPAERRSIAMQHAQKCAVTILEVAASHGDYRPPNAGDVVTQVKAVAAALFQQVQQAEAGTINQ